MDGMYKQPLNLLQERLRESEKSESKSQNRNRKIGHAKRGQLNWNLWRRWLRPSLTSFRLGPPDDCQVA